MPLRYDDDAPTVELSGEHTALGISDREFVSLITRFARQGCWPIDIDSSHYHVSKSVCDIFGIDHTDGPASMLRFREQLHPDDRDILNEALSIASERQCSFAVVYRVKNGECWKFVRSVGRYRAVEGTSGEIIGITHELVTHMRELVMAD